MPKTTQADLDIFEEEGRYWIEEFGLKDFEVFFIRRKLAILIASCEADYDGRTAVITLATKWSGKVIELNEENLRFTARHEIVELVLADMWHLIHASFKSLDEAHHVRESAAKRIEKNLKERDRGSAG